MPFQVEAVCLAAEKGVQKHEVAQITLRAGFGVEGDGHAGPGHRQVSLLAGEAVGVMRAKGLKLALGAFGENIVTRGANWRRARVGQLIAIDEALLEITQIGKECRDHCALYAAAGECIMPHAGDLRPRGAGRDDPCSQSR